MTHPNDSEVDGALFESIWLPQAPGQLRWERVNDELGRRWRLWYGADIVGMLMEDAAEEHRCYRVWARKGEGGEDSTARFDGAQEAAEALLEHMREYYPQVCKEQQGPSQAAPSAETTLREQLRRLWEVAKAVPAMAWQALKERLLRQRPEDRGQL